MNLLDGASRLHFIVGEPISQVKSPAGVTHALQSKGFNSPRSKFLGVVNTLRCWSGLEGLGLPSPMHY
jgi:hypothetical protein